MKKKTTGLICLNCKQPFVPNWRNRKRQRFCQKPECRKASKTLSQQIWVANNPDHFRKSKGRGRVRQWRATPPDGGKRSQVQSQAAPLQDVVQDSVSRNPLIYGLIADLYGCALQDFVEEKIRSLIMKGVKIQLGKAEQKEPIKRPALVS